MLKIIGLILVVLIVALLIYAATKPDTFRIERSVTIIAPPEKAFGLINDLHQWVSWSPWEKMDPSMKKTHRGAPQGKGAVLEWDGNKDVGQGRMEILESLPSSKILIKLDFFKPFAAHNQAEFALTTNASSTQVAWAMYGPQPYMMKVMGLFCSMDKMVGGQFEQGLADLKTLAEK